MSALQEAVSFDFANAENGLWLPSRTLELPENLAIKMFEGVVDLSHLSTPDLQVGECEVVFPYGILSGIEYGHGDMDRAIDAVKPIAETIWEFGNSHRGFTTGGVGLARSKYIGHDEMLVVWVNNNKPRPGVDPDRACTEETLIEKMRMLRARRISAMIIYAENQPDDRTGIAELTLPACGNCRDVFMQDPLITPRTLIVSRNPRTKQEIRRNVGRLHDVYGMKSAV